MGDYGGGEQYHSVRDHMTAYTGNHMLYSGMLNIGEALVVLMSQEGFKHPSNPYRTKWEETQNVKDYEITPAHPKIVKFEILWG